MTSFKARGQAFFDAVLCDFDLSVDERELLIEICRTLDLCDDLHDVIERDGLTVPGSAGQDRVHPAVGELRGARLALNRLLATLGLPGEDGQVIASPERLRARRAAAARWSDPGRNATAVSDAARAAASTRWQRHRDGA